MSNPDVVIVGAGLAGLTAAASLAGAGLKLELIEEAKEIGGRLAAMGRDGYRFDAGLHCFHYGDAGVIGALRGRLGLELTELVAPELGYLLRGKDRLPIPAEAASDSREVPGFTDAETRRIQDFFGLLLAAKAKDGRRRSVAEFLAEHGLAEDDLVRDYAGALALTLLGRGLDQVSAGLLVSHAQTVGRVGFHVSTVAGGPGAIIEALAARLDRDRVKLCLGTMVQEIEVKAGKAVKLTTSAAETAPAAVIYTGPFKKLPDLITGDGLDPTLTRRLARLEPVAGIALELGAASRLSDITGVMIDPAEAVIGRFPSNLDPSLAPEGGQLSSWLMLVAPEDLADKRLTRDHINRLKKIVKRQFHGAFDAARLERLRVIPVVSSVAPTPKQALKKESIRAKGANNLFLAGDGAVDGGVLSGTAVHSALLAAEAVKKLLAGDDTTPDDEAKEK